jgi:hypothetical protein
MIANSPGAQKIFFPRINLEAVSHITRVVHAFLLPRWQVSRANIYTYKLTSCRA